MSAKRSRMGRSSSSNGFNNYAWLKTIEPPHVASKTQPAPSPNPVQKQTKPVVPVQVAVPRPSIFTVEPLDECREKADDVRRDFCAMCYHCKRAISEDKNVYMYGYLQAFCSLECRHTKKVMDEKTRKS